MKQDGTSRMLNYCEAVAVSDKLQEVTMKSASKIFRRSTGLEDVCSKVNDFVTELGKNRLISISTMVEPTTAWEFGPWLSVAANPLEYVVIVWYCEAEEASASK